MAPDLVWPDPAVFEALPAERPMSYEQAEVATWLGGSLRHHAAEAGLLWHVGVNDPVDFFTPAAAGGAGTPRRVFPDLLVVTGMAQRPDGHYRVWVEERPPDLALEVSTATSLAQDQGEKLALYRDLGVREYFIFDLVRRRVPGLLEGFRLDAQGAYARLASTGPPGAARLWSEVLALELAVVPEPLIQGGSTVRAFRRGGAVPIPFPTDARVLAEKQAALAREQAALAEKQAAERARDEALERLQAREAELARLRAELEARRGPSPGG